ncbi:hypothetical protein M513_06728 [Trichuris suis]|uniref:WD domain, G-beta repeat protein n=1 Tax=Trichuris suis TaxID=68888 RepID=A0A085M551_9BILA|nr:hypothetical protein M513_06728 [Trichuris suis]
MYTFAFSFRCSLLFAWFLFLTIPRHMEACGTFSSARKSKYRITALFDSPLPSRQKAQIENLLSALKTKPIETSSPERTIEIVDHSYPNARMADCSIRIKGPSLGTSEMVHVQEVIRSQINILHFLTKSQAKWAFCIMPFTVPLRFGHSQGITSICVSEKLKRIVTGGEDGQLRFWENFEDNIPQTYDVADEGDTVLVATEKGVVNAHESATGKFDSTVTRFSLPITHMVVSKSGHLLVASSDFEVRWISLHDKTFQRLDGHEAPVFSVSVDPFTVFASTACADGYLRIWQLSDVSCIKTLRIFPKVNEFRLTYPLARMDWFPNLGNVLAVPTGREVQIYDRNEWLLLKSYKVEDSDASICCYDSTGARLAAACMSGSIFVWETGSDTLIFRDVHPKGRALCALFWNPFKCGQLLLADVNGFVGGFQSIDATEIPVDNVPSVFSNEQEVAVSHELPLISDDENSTDFDISKIKSTYSAKLNDLTDAAADSQLTIEKLGLLLKNWQSSLLPKPFNPGSTPLAHGEHYMKWNRVGTIRHYVSREMGNVIDVEFHNVSVHHALHFQNEVSKYSIGDLSDEAVAFASYEDENSGSQVYISYFASWDSPKEWYIDVPFGESVQCLCLGKGWVAFTTSSRLLRVYTLSGVFVWISTIENSVVAMSARGSRLFLVYHDGMALSGDVRLCYCAYMFDEESSFYGVVANTSQNNSVPLSAGASLKWLCVTELGTFCTADSFGTVRILVNGAWIPVCTLNDPDKIDQEYLWPVDLQEETSKILCVCCKRSKVPSVMPKPAMVYVSWKIPTCDVSHMKGDSGELALVTNIKGQLFRHTNLTPNGSSLKEVGIDRSSLRSLLKTFAIACKAENYEYALDVASLSTTESNLRVFLRYACENDCNVLAEKLESLRKERYDKEAELSQSFQRSEVELPKLSLSLKYKNKAHTVEREEDEQVEEETTSRLSLSFALSPDRSAYTDDLLSATSTPSVGGCFGDLPTPSPGKPYNPFKVRLFRFLAAWHITLQKRKKVKETELSNARSVFDFETPKKQRPTADQASQQQNAKKREKAEFRTLDALFKSTTSTQATTGSISEASQDLFPNMVCRDASAAEKEEVPPFETWFAENREVIVRDFSGNSTDDKALIKFALSQYRQANKVCKVKMFSHFFKEYSFFAASQLTMIQSAVTMLNQSDRKAELERKKAKLAAIREEKKRKEEERRKHNAEASFNDDVESGAICSRNLREEADKILTELGIAPVSDGLPLSTSADESVLKSAELGSEAARRDTGVIAPTDAPKRPVELQATEPVVISISPRQQITYCKSTQTIADQSEKELTAMHMYEWDDEFGGGTHHGRSVSVSSPEEVFDMDSTPAHIIAGILPHVELIKPTEVPKGGKASETVNAPAAPVPELTEEEKQSFLSSEELQSFLVRASRVVERAIAEKDDVFADYGRGIEQDKLDTSVKLSLNRCFYNESLLRGRCVNCIDFSVQYPELMAVAYDGNPDAMNDPVGLVTVWNGKFKKNTPEYCFHSQSRVLSLTWAKFHPNLLVAGTYSGQICLWDMRQSKRTPIQKSALSTPAHTHPIYCLEVVGSANAHNVVSVSTDGKLCSWSLEMLSQPQETLDLQLKQSKQVGAYCMRFAPNDVNNFFIGSDDGCVYAGCRHGNKAGITDVYEGHSGTTAGMDIHAATGPIDFSNLMLTCSFDWTVKLWNTKELKPLYSFENNSDYVFDVAWSPAHPALFASVDGTGKLELWHLNQDTELPVASLTVEGGAALKSLVWARSGMQIVVGGDDGKVWAYDVNEQLAVPTPNEWSLLSKTLYELKQNEMEAEELNATLNFR